VGGIDQHAVINVENVTGSVNADVIIANGAANVLDGGLGADSIAGFGGADRLIGGLGDDTLNGGADNDVFVYADTIEGVDLLQGFIFGQDMFEIDGDGFGISSMEVWDGDNFTQSDVSMSGVYSNATGKEMFILDASLAPGEKASLWFDVNGDGTGAVIRPLIELCRLQPFSLHHPLICCWMTRQKAVLLCRLFLLIMQSRFDQTA
jgi:RTX calcium-binding nonapeptide repeat (4 copies)